MSHLHAILRSLLKDGVSLSALLAQANTLFSEGTLSRHFATLVFGRADSSGRVELCNAGHCPPFIIRGSKLEIVPPTSYALGLFAHGTFQTRVFQLEPDDSLFLYTDGLIEARNPVEVQYGEERLSELISKRAALPPRELTAACRDDLVNFLAGAKRLDDLAILVLKKEG